MGKLLKRKREKEGNEGAVPSGQHRTTQSAAVHSILPATGPGAIRPHGHHHSDDNGHGNAMRAVMVTAARKRATVVARRSVESNGGIRPGNAGRKKDDISFR